MGLEAITTCERQEIPWTGFQSINGLTYIYTHTAEAHKCALTFKPIEDFVSASLLNLPNRSGSRKLHREEHRDYIQKDPC